MYFQLSGNFLTIFYESAIGFRNWTVHITWTVNGGGCGQNAKLWQMKGGLEIPTFSHENPRYCRRIVWSAICLLSISWHILILKCSVLHILLCRRELRRTRKTQTLMHKEHLICEKLATASHCVAQMCPKCCRTSCRHYGGVSQFIPCTIHL